MHRYQILARTAARSKHANGKAASGTSRTGGTGEGVSPITLPNQSHSGWRWGTGPVTATGGMQFLRLSASRSVSAFIVLATVGTAVPLQAQRSLVPTSVTTFSPFGGSSNPMKLGLAAPKHLFVHLLNW